MNAPHARIHCLAVVCLSIVACMAIRFGILTVLEIQAANYSNAIGRLLVTLYSLLALIGIAMVTWRKQLARTLLQEGDDNHLPLLALVLGVVAIPLIAFGVPTEWDEVSHVLSGMWIRGYHVPHEAHRSPVSQFLAALTFPFTHLINPALLAALAVTCLFWCRRFSHPLFLFYIALLLLASKHFMIAVTEVMGELPASVALATAFYLLTRNRLTLCGVCLALAVLSRWNLASFAIITVAFVAWRVSIRQAILMALIGLAFFAAWAVWSHVTVGASLELLRGYAANSHAGGDGVSENVLTPLTRLEFYSRRLYYLSMAGLLAVLASPFIQRPHLDRHSEEVFRYLIPTCIFLYMIVLVMTGDFLPRLTTPMVVIALLLFSELACSVALQCRIPRQAFAITLIALLPLAAATVTSNYHVAHVFARKITHQPALPADLVSAIRALPKETALYTPPFYKISRSSEGREVRILLRRNVIFHPDESHATLEQIFARTLQDEIRDFEPFVDIYIRSAPEDALLLVPEEYRGHIEPESIIIESGGWIVAEPAPPPRP